MAAPTCSSFTPDHRTCCKYGPMCKDTGADHRAKFDHSKYPACQYGLKCYRKNLEHLREFVHPGDRNYRNGMVFFPVRRGEMVKPEFSTMRDLFNYCDPDESGNISRDEFQEAYEFLRGLPPELFDQERGNQMAFEDNPDAAWQHACGEDRSHLTFAQFAKWASGTMLKLPVGIELGEGADRQCRFHYAGGERCPCVKFEQPKSGQPNMCACGHKSSVHFSDVALMSVEEQEVLNRLKRKTLRSSTTGGGLGFLISPSRRPGFTMVTDKEVLHQLQQLLNVTHKTSDNWTRDRGCALHGRNACETRCVFSNKAPVPTCYKLLRAERNRNEDLWSVYATTRAAIKEECESSGSSFVSYNPLSAAEVKGEELLDPSINEWRLLHGTGLAACKGICGTNFQLKMAGSGATWKPEGKASGTPLYGYGVYCAENSTKADEYAEVITDGLPADIGCCAMLVCRVVGGLCKLVDTNEFDTDELRRDVFDGPHHSVFGDRVTKLGKPFREIVVYDSSQIFPEFILYYQRCFE